MSNNPFDDIYQILSDGHLTSGQAVSFPCTFQVPILEAPPALPGYAPASSSSDSEANRPSLSPPLRWSAADLSKFLQDITSFRRRLTNSSLSPRRRLPRPSSRRRHRPRTAHRGSPGTLFPSPHGTVPPHQVAAAPRLTIRLCGHRAHWHRSPHEHSADHGGNGSDRTGS